MLPPSEPSPTGRGQTRTLKVLWGAFLTLWVLGQVVYGAVAPWAVAATTAGLAVLYALAVAAVPDAPGFSRPLAGFLVAGFVLVLLQLLPLGFLFPQAAAWRGAHGVGGAWPGTADAFLTVRTFAQAAGYALTALLVLRLRRGGLSSSGVMKGLLGVLVLQAAFALVRLSAGIDHVPFYDERVGGFSGTLVSRNQFGGMMAMGLVGAVALAYSRFAWGRRVQAGVGWALAAALFALALVLSRSRGGAIAAGAGLALLPLLHRGGASGAAAAGVGVLAAVGVALADPAVLLERFEALDPFAVTEDSRWTIWTSTARAAMDQPVLGFGLGTHPHAYHPYQPTALAGQIHHAHNEYVNFLFEGGFALLLLLAGGFALWMRRSLEGARRHAGPERFLPVAAIAAAGAEAVHAFVDMDLRVTSVGMLFAALVGLGASLARPAAPSRHGALGVSLVSLVAAGAVFLPIRPEPLIQAAPRQDPAGAERLLARALGLSPFHFKAAWVRAETSGDDRRFETAGDLWPANPALQGAVGLWAWQRGDPARAAKALRRGFEQRPSDVERVMPLVWDPARPVSDYEALLPPRTPAAWGVFAGFLATAGRWKEAMAAFERGVPARESNAAAYDRFADRLGAASQWGLEAVVRDRRLEVKSDPAAHAASAEAWRKLGALPRAIERIGKARLTDPANPAWAAQEGELRRAAGDRDGALKAYVAAVSLAPLDMSHVRRRALLYEELKLAGPAAEDWRRILRSHPADRAAALGLARALLAQGDRTGARRALDDLLARDPADAEARALREQIR